MIEPTDQELDEFCKWLKQYITQRAGYQAKAVLKERMLEIEEERDWKLAMLDCLRRRAQITSIGVQMELPLE